MFKQSGVYQNIIAAVVYCMYCFVEPCFHDFPRGFPRGIFGSISKYYCCCSLLHVLFCGTVFPRLSSGVSPRYFYCGKTTVTSVQAVTVIKHNYRYCATRYREKTHLQIPCKTEEFIFSPYRKTNYRAKSGVPAISGYRGVNFRNYDKTPTTAQK